MTDEVYLEIVLNPAFGKLFTNEQERKEISNLASALERNHLDNWLVTFLGSPLTEDALSRLRSAVELNHKGRPQEAIREARTARTSFMKLGNNAGAARSQFEIIYALQRQSKPQVCLAEAARLAALLRYEHFYWLQAELLLESASCEGMLAKFDSAWTNASAAVTTAKAYNYSTLSLRALGFQAALHTGEGRLAQAWVTDIEGLKLFWDGVFVADRAYQFLSDLEITAEHYNKWYLASILENEIVELLPEIDRSEISAITHFTAGGIRQSIGDSVQAEKEFRASERYFEQLPQNSFTSLYRSYAQISLATLQLHRGNAGQAQETLQRVRASIPENGTFTLQLAYWKARAEAAQYTKDFGKEEACLKQVLRIAAQGFSALESATDRWEWDREVGSAYRRLLDLHLERPHDVFHSFANWEVYRWQQTTASQVSLKVAANHVATVRARVNGLHDSTLISFAVLQKELVTWVADDRGVREYRKEVDVPDLARQISNFYGICSNVNSPIEKVKAAGSRLYQLLLKPLEGELDGKRTLFIESDGMLGLVPWSALTMPDERYFSEAYKTILSPGILYPAYGPEAVRPKRALVVYPGAIALQGVHYPPLPQAEEEAAFVSARYARTTFLQGTQSNAKNVLDRIGAADLFHFAGHAFSRDYGGELVIRNGNEGDILAASKISKLRLRKNALVVLSACSTAASSDDAAKDPHGLVWAFLQAGAGRVLASRWNVDSSATQSLVEDFYSTLQNGSPAASLNASQALLRRQGNASHPYYWASFELFGNVIDARN